jgi:hypothetical protein
MWDVGCDLILVDENEPPIIRIDSQPGVIKVKA